MVLISLVHWPFRKKTPGSPKPCSRPLSPKSPLPSPLKIQTDAKMARGKIPSERHSDVARPSTSGVRHSDVTPHHSYGCRPVSANLVISYDQHVYLSSKQWYHVETSEMNPQHQHYIELCAVAERQKQQIQNNSHAITQRESRLLGQRQQDSSVTHQALSERLRVLRQRVKGEESTLATFRSLKSQLDMERAQAKQPGTNLDTAKAAYSRKEAELLRAVAKVEELKYQLEDLRQRKGSGRNSDLERLREELGRRKISHSEQSALLERQRALLGDRTGESARLDRQMEDLLVKWAPPRATLTSPLAQPVLRQRPQAAVEPFQINTQATSGDSDVPETHKPTESSKLDVITGLEPLPHSQAGVTAAYLNSTGYTTALETVQGVLEKESSSPVPYRKMLPSTSNSLLTGSLGPKPYVPPPRDPPARQKLCLTSSNAPQQDASAEGAKMRNRRFAIPDATALGDATPPDIIPSEDRKNFGQREDPAQGTDVTDAGSLHPDRDVDSLALRKDNIRAVKRRSWADHATNDEAEHIRRVLCREQAKGRSINLSWIFTDAKNPTPAPNLNPDSPVEAPRVTWITGDIKKGPERPDSLPIMPPPELELTGDSSAMTASSSSDEDATLTAGSESPLPEVPLPPPPDKGILRGEGIAGSGRRIRFAPLALLLDAALEGELELVKKSAEQLSDVSQCNDEGITALHNAICAGNYDIVRFLVEASADVNAQDADGWTPLHCAASCNNLPTVKFLVEHGACVFATTLSDHEIPYDKLEEDEDGYRACAEFLKGVHEMLGTINNGRVHAAYTYSAEQQDEVSFQAGDEMSVLQRDEERGWWRILHVKSSRDGLVPRNYLAMYPRVASKMSPTSPQQTIPEACFPSDKNNNENTPLPQLVC